LRPQLQKGSVVNDEGTTVTVFSRTVYTNPSGQAADGSVSVSVINLQNLFRLQGLDTRYTPTFNTNTNMGTANSVSLPNLGNVSDVNGSNFGTHSSIFTSGGFISSILFVSVGQFTTAIERLADARAENGAEQSRLGMTNELLIQNQTNLEAAYGRIMDADVALESTRFARQNVLVQSSAAMVAQANQLTSIALQILG
jgi:flagellin-like hook-associated protein FlgL